MDLKKATATKGGKIHIAPLKSNMSLCLQYVGEKIQDIQDKNVTCKRCLKAYEKYINQKIECVFEDSYSGVSDGITDIEGFLIKREISNKLDRGEIGKAYVIYESWGTCDDSSVIGVFLDENKANEYIKERNKDREKETEYYGKCSKCRKTTEDKEIFKYENSCKNAVIKEDRHGLYCENDMSDFYSMSSNSYWKVETNILEE